jgi:ArsR family transcriptional regulator
MINEDIFYDQYALMCRTIVNPIRLRIIHEIGDKKMNVSEIQKSFNISMSNLSNHLSALYKVGILCREKKGNFIYYYLTDPDLLKVLNDMKQVIRSISLKRNGIIKK